MIEQFIQYAQQQNSDKHGSSKKCFIKGGYALLSGAINAEEIQKTIKIEQQLMQEGIPVVPTIDYKIVDPTSTERYSQGYILQHKAPGEELYSSQTSEQNYAARLQELANQPQEFYGNFVSDWLKIEKSGLQIDPSKSSNFFYTPERIHFIDLNPCDNHPEIETSFHNAAVVLFNGGMYYRSSENRRQQADILRKTAAAFIKHGANTEKLSEIAHRHFPEIAAKAFPPTPRIIKSTDHSL